VATALLTKCLLHDVGPAIAAQLPASAAGWLLDRRQFRQWFPATWSQSTAYRLFGIHFNTLLPSIPRSTKWFHSFSFPTKPCMYLFSLTHAMCPAHLIVLWIHSGAADSGTALQARRLQVKFLMELLDFSTWSFWLHYGSGVDSESNRNEYQEYLLG
jgi:hypothetical protein